MLIASASIAETSPGVPALGTPEPMGSRAVEEIAPVAEDGTFEI